jgi:probable HAF family extracellular repeat protein
MMTLDHLAPAGMIFTIFVASAGAQPTFLTVAPFPGGAGSAAWSVSASGAVVAGEAQNAAGYFAARWTPQGGTQLLYTPEFQLANYAHGVSADGSVIVGTDNFHSTAYRWTAATGRQLITRLPGSTWAAAENISGDGSTVVGAVTISQITSAMRWTAETGMQNLGNLPGGGGQSSATATSADGSIVVGWSSAPSGQRGFVWTQAQGMMDLGTLPGRTRSTAYDVSADGARIVGESGTPNAGNSHACLWTAPSAAVDLGVLPGSSGSIAFAISADGSTVVGRSAIGNTTRAFYWTEATGMLDLTQLTSAVLPAGFQLLAARDVSGDGTVVVGEGRTAAGQNLAWVITIPEPGVTIALASGIPLVARRRRPNAR